MEKAASTWRRRGIRFEDAASVFMDPLLVLTDASRHDEARDAVIGFDQLGRLTRELKKRGVSDKVLGEALRDVGG
ncbi:MAG: BrnT family toxin [Rhodanobacter sp.]|nr:MAG: BrnT family toxin [Rhodanobacter sp.]TAM00502.1 MAG: BrnT family toxin [Rhodanobacter sp.]TAM38146.1 MAG: BrnT family toxin [Rhodanobacter sp.]TAN25416.1 MAG: BrnT family toxin [Rhodanobacter sp.]